MKLKMKLVVASLAASAGLSMTQPAMADLGTGAVSGAGGSTTARLNFSIVIPAYLRLSVGTPTAASIDTVTFTATAATAGSGTAIAGSGTVAVVVQANGATGGVNLTYTANTTGIGAPGAPTWAEVTVTTLGNIGAAGPTALSATANTAVASLGNVSGLVNKTDTWTFNYLNTGVYPAGTYAGQITYTATEF